MQSKRASRFYFLSQPHRLGSTPWPVVTGPVTVFNRDLPAFHGASSAALLAENPSNIIAQLQSSSTDIEPRFVLATRSADAPEDGRA
jgi:hypothetical protein